MWKKVARRGTRWWLAVTMTIRLTKHINHWTRWFNNDLRCNWWKPSHFQRHLLTSRLRFIHEECHFKKCFVIKDPQNHNRKLLTSKWFNIPHCSAGNDRFNGQLLTFFCDFPTKIGLLKSCVISYEDFKNYSFQLYQCIFFSVLGW